ncbi:MAG: hypothetical protein ABI690_29855 [Chloroflexota bacterium]
MKWLAIITFLLSIEALSTTTAQTSTLPCSQSNIIGTLNLREPTIEDIQNYLCLFALGDDGQPDSSDLSENTELIYRDVNGDREPDLIVSDYLYVGVLLWLPDRNEYTFAFQTHALHSPRNPASKVSFEDWTDDGIPEIIFDSRWAVSGTDIGGDHWVKSIIHCEVAICMLAWSDELDTYSYFASAQDGMYLRQSELKLITEPDGKLVLQKMTSEFVTDCSYSCKLNNDLIQSFKDYGPFQVSDIVQSRFVWNGKTFEPADETVVQKGYIVDANSDLDAVNSNGRQATISVEKVESGAAYRGLRDSCQVMVDDINVGEAFLCVPNYTQVNWIDLTSDGHAELVVKVFASLLNGQEVSFHPCAYQRLMVYQITENRYQRIANVAGCMTSEDFFGVRLEDVDGDGQPEIVSAGQLTTDLPDDCFGGFCWYELRKQNDIYKWNGHQFAYWETVPRAG